MNDITESLLRKITQSLFLSHTKNPKRISLSFLTQSLFLSQSSPALSCFSQSSPNPHRFHEIESLNLSIVAQSSLSFTKLSLSISLALGSWGWFNSNDRFVLNLSGELLLDCSVVSNFSFNLKFFWFLFCKLLLVLVLIRVHLVLVLVLWVDVPAFLLTVFLFWLGVFSFWLCCLWLWCF
jgi:hypothetical protein